MDNKYRIEENRLLAYDRRFFGFAKEPCSSINLDAVKFISWEISPFSRTETVHLVLWDGQPKFAPGLFPGDILNTDEGVHKLGRIRTPDFLKDRGTHETFVVIFAPRIDNREVVSMVDLDSLQPFNDVWESAA